MDVKLFHFMEYERSEATVFSLRKIYGSDSPAIYCLIASFFFPDTEEEIIIWLPVDPDREFRHFYEDTSYVRGRLRLYKHINSPSVIVSSVVSPIVSFLFACVPKISKNLFSASVQTKRLALDLMRSRLTDR